MSTTDRLKNLGDTAEEVAASLFEQGFLGVPRSSNACPVILFVNSLPNIRMKAPRPGVITWDDIQTMDPVCPRPVAEMMRRFDTGDFPELRSPKNINL